MATYDLDAIRTYGASHIGSYTYNCVDTDDGKLQVAYSSCPQSTGFNIVPLQVPDAGTEVKVIFSALPAGRTNLTANDPGQYLNGSSTFADAGVTKYNSFSGTNYRGFRHGYVALLADGTRVYQSVDTVYGVATTTAERYRSMTDTTTFVVPSGTKQLFFVVSPAPTKYIVHNWDENITNDDQWPYQLEIENTDVVGHIPSIDLSDTSILPSDPTLDVYVGFNASSNTYPGTTYTLTSKELKAIGEALRVQPANIGGLMRSYSASQANGTIQFLGVNTASGKNTVVNGASTANGYGHWFSQTGNVVSYGTTAYVYSEFDANTMTFTIGQYPGKCSNGQVYKLGQAFRYKDSNGKTGIARIIFHIYIGGVPTDIEGIHSDTMQTGLAIKGIYDITGRIRQDASHLAPGIYIVNGKKVLLK